MAELRELRPEDAHEVAALFERKFGEDRRVDAEEVISWTANSDLRPEWLRVLVDDGTIVGYADIWPADNEVAVDIAAPRLETWGLFLDWAEGHAQTEGIPRTRVFLPAGAEPVALLERRGYRLWRSSYTMEIALAARPDRPELPAGIALRPYDPADAETLRASLNAAFAEDPFWHTVSPANFQEFYLGARGYDPSLWLLGWDGAQLAGSVLAFPERVGETDLGWVGTLSVGRAWRRRGLGTALLRMAFSELYDRGLRRVGLGVDAENVTGALRVYERAGMHRVRQGDNWILER